MKRAGKWAGALPETKTGCAGLSSHISAANNDEKIIFDKELFSIIDRTSAGGRIARAQAFMAQSSPFFSPSFPCSQKKLQTYRQGHYLRSTLRK
jgi:hypothetical protein